MKIKNITKSLLATSVLLTSLSSQAALITFDFLGGGPNAQEITFADSDHTLNVAGFKFDDGLTNFSSASTFTAETINHAVGGLGVQGGSGNRITAGDFISFSLFDADASAVTFDSIKLVFTDITGSSLFSRETAIVAFGNDDNVEIQGIRGNSAGLESFTINALNSSSFDLAILTDVNGFTLAGLELEIADPVVITDPTTSVPEPATFAIFSLALAGLFSRKVKKS